MASCAPDISRAGGAGTLAKPLPQQSWQGTSAGESYSPSAGRIVGIDVFSHAPERGANRVLKIADPTEGFGKMVADRSNCQLVCFSGDGPCAMHADAIGVWHRVSAERLGLAARYASD